MYKIGEFSKLTGLSIRTLRYYNDIGILVPEEVNIFTNYRYYGDKNLEDARLIGELKEAGFSLDEIMDNWNKFSDDLFVKKREELYKQMEDVENEIKKLDEIRSKVHNGKIMKDLESVKLMKLWED